MTYYVRYYEKDAIFGVVEEILPYLSENNWMEPDELKLVEERLAKPFKKGIHKIFLDEKQAKYVLIINKEYDNIEQYREKSRKPDNDTAIMEQPVVKLELLENEEPAVEAKPEPKASKKEKKRPATAETKDDSVAQAEDAQPKPADNPDSEKQPAGKDTAVAHGSNWKLYTMKYFRLVDGNKEPYIFKAKIENASSVVAYHKMYQYLKEQHGDNCLLPEYSNNVLTIADCK